MSLVDRLVSLSGGLLLLAMGVLLGLGAFGVRAPLEWVLQLTYGFFDAVIISLMLGLLGVYLILFGWYETRNLNDEAVVKQTDLGTVHVSFDSVRSVIKQAIEGIDGVRRVAIRFVARDPLQVELDLHLLPGVKIPDVTEKVQKDVGHCLRQTIGIEIGDVQVVVRSVAAPAKAKL